MKREYKPWNPGPEAARLVDWAIEIGEDYAADGYDLTLRQLYYQFVSRDLIPNTEKSYNRIGDIVDRARLAGMLDWTFIIDRGRNVRSNSHWYSPASVVRSAAAGYRNDLWEMQSNRLEVWVEKEALSGVVQRPCEELDVAYFACKGYVSQSEMWAAAQRFKTYMQTGQSVTILHLGDHDPSGIDMTRDIQDRLNTFVETDRDYEGFDGSLYVNRIALNMEQIEEHRPPPNPAKTTDSRFQAYLAEYGDESWELDALDPATLDRLIREEIDTYIDRTAWDAAVAAQEDDRDSLNLLSRKYSTAIAHLREAS